MNVRYPSCLLCPWQKEPIHGDGPLPCKVLFVGEGPAYEETRRHLVFCGDTGQELDGQYLYASGLTRPRVRVTNIVKCPSPGYDNPEQELADCCARYWLPGELEAANPEILVLMGAIACRAIFPDIDLEREHGIPSIRSCFGWTGIVFPMYHPSAGLHQPRYMRFLRADFETLGRLYRGEWTRVEDAYPNPVYRLVEREEDLAHAFDLARYGNRVIRLPSGRVKAGSDTETDGDDPYCLSFSLAPGTGWVLMVRDRELLGSYRRRIRELDPLWIFHNWMFDGEVYQKLDMETPRFLDTMVRCYHRGFQQALKIQAYRLCGMEMLEYEDVVHPHSKLKVMDWVAACIRSLGPEHEIAALDKDLFHRLEKLRETGWPPGKTAKWKNRALLDRIGYLIEAETGLPGVLSALEGSKGRWDDLAVLKRSLASLDRSLLAHFDEFNPWKRWKEWSKPKGAEAGEEEAEASGGEGEGGEEGGTRSKIELFTKYGLGTMPRATIADVPLSELVPYSAADSDGALRLLSRLPHLPRINAH